MVVQDKTENPACEVAQWSSTGVDQSIASERQAPEGLTLLALLAALAQRKALITKITATAAVLGIGLALLLPVRYTAVCRIMPPQQTQSSASFLLSQMQPGGEALAALTGDGLGLKNPNDLYIGMLKSRPIADAIIHDFGLDRIYRSPDMSEARNRLAGYTHIESEKSGLVAITVTDRDKFRAAAMANAYTSQLRVLTQNLALTEASQRRLFYEQQLVQAGKALVSAEAAFQQVQQSRGLVSLNGQSAAMIESLAVLRAQISAKQVQLEALRSYSTERNPEVALARQELASMQAEEARLEHRNRATEAGDLGLGDIPGVGREYLTAEHELAYRQTLYDLLVKQYDAARLDEGKEAAIIQVIEPAIAPDRKSSPKRVLIVIVASFLGWFAACFYVLAAMALARARTDPEIDFQLSALRHALLPGMRRPSA